MTTAKTIIRGALRLLEVYPIGSTSEPTTAEYTDLLEELNNLLKAWQTETSIIPSITQESFTLTAGQQVYTYGSGGDFNSVRPIKISDAFFRSNSIDYQLKPLSREQYFDIVDKTIQSIPGMFFYDPLATLGKFYLYPTSDSADTLFIDSYKPFTGFATTTTDWDAPDEWLEAIKYNLAVVLAPQIPAQLSPLVLNRARYLKNNLVIANFDTGVMKTDFPDMSKGNKYYNFFRGF
jgi:hypothetical protein